MKNIGIITILLTFFLTVGCNEGSDDYIAPDELSDVSWYMSINQNSQNPYSISGGDFISFLDLSQGATSHEWIIEEGNNFLNEQFKKGDSIPLFINKEAGLSITDGKAHVLFNNNGENKVRLINKFSDSVSYNSIVSPLSSYKEGDFWVIDTTFVFDVYGDLLPAFKVLQDDVEILSITEEDMPSEDDMESWPTVEVEAGSFLTFVDLTTVDRPNGRTWDVPAGTPDKTGGESAKIKFFKLGEYPAGTLKSSRNSPLPSASAEKIIPLMVKVIPSSEPFLFAGSLKELENETIRFQVTGEITPFTDQEGFFTVKIKNEAAGLDPAIEIAVQNAKVDPDDATFIQISLAQPIYNSDIVSISYSGGSITSTDTRVLQDFENKYVNMYFESNILTKNSWASYEVAHGGLNKAYAGPGNSFWVGANGTEADPNWSRTTEKASEGTASMRFSVDGISKPFQLHQYGLGTIDMVPAGTYKASYMVYVESGNTMDGFWTWGGEVPGLATELWSLTDIAKGEWVKIEHTATLAEISSKKKLSIVINPPTNPNAGTGRQTLYIDDFSLVPVEIRP